MKVKLVEPDDNSTHKSVVCFLLLVLVPTLLVPMQAQLSERYFLTSKQHRAEYK